MNVDHNLKNEKLITELIKASHNYSYYCGKGYLFLCLDKNDIDNMLVYVARYEPSSFMHLCGIKSIDLSAIDFYRCCLDSSITIGECTPAYDHTLSDVSEKVSILSSLLNIKNLKMFRADNPDIQPPKAKFDLGIGNNTGFIGYRYDKVIMKFIPVTNMPQPLSKYCFDPQKISMAFSKNFEEESYKTIEFEVSKNLLNKLDVQYYYILQDLIDKTLLDKSFSHYFDEEFEAKMNLHDNDLEK